MTYRFRAAEMLVDRVGRDLDYYSALADARRAMGPRQVLLGNIDPVRVLPGKTPGSVESAIAQCHKQAGPRYIVGAGCEIPRDTPPENVRALVEYAISAVPRPTGLRSN